MASRRWVAAALAASLLGARSAQCDEVRYFEKDGVTYCETRRIVDRRVPESRMEQRTETVYRQRLTTEMQDTTRTDWTPRTEYRWEAYWVGQWNLLARPSLAYRYVPRTHWEPRTVTVKVPVTALRSVPETQTVRRPVAGWRTEQQEEVSRVAVRGRPTGSPLAPLDSPVLARRGAIGGISRLDGHLPRYGTSTAWRASSDAIRR
jgi:hypothetical protein